MKRIARAFSLLICLFETGPVVAVEKPLIVSVWPGKPADDDASKIDPEKFFELQG